MHGRGAASTSIAIDASNNNPFGRSQRRACGRIWGAIIIIELMTAGPDGPSSAASPLVLIVEDDAETRQIYTLALAIDGFRTEQAHNGFQAFEKALAEVPDLILTDIAVPGIDGIELCRRLRAHERTWRIPVLAVTGYGDRGYDDRARDAGADHVLLKPCSGDLLVAEARRLLASSHALRDRADRQMARSEAVRARADRVLQRSARVKARSSHKLT
jgi:DNA-binding response OmpR family regulator